MYKDNNKNDLSVNERPYERFLAFGASALTDAELLAVIIRSGSRKSNALALANAVLRLCPYEEGLTGICHLSMEELTKLEGIGTVKAMQIKAVAELSARIAQSSGKKDLLAGTPGSIARYYMERLRHMESEHVYCMMLDNRNRFISDVCLSKGTVNMSLISPRDIYISALERHAVNCVLVHNHPSGDPTPSPEDTEITARAAEAGKIIGVQLLDHIIIGDMRYYSFANSGLL